jgi:hypothetical protein
MFMMHAKGGFRYGARDWHDGALPSRQNSTSRYPMNIECLSERKRSER